MQNPAQGIAPDLLPHVHCISTYRYPAFQSIHAQKVAEWLLTAPKLAKETAPYYWSYLDRPINGMILQTWQPEQLGVQFASDGYIWIGNETAYTLPIENYGDLHIYHYTAGYAPGDAVATHARRRYRLVPHQNRPDVEINPQLWITHYLQAEPQDRVATSAFLPDPRTQQTLQLRAYLQVQGQIQMKEFMLLDRSKWPVISFPGRTPQKPSPSLFNPMGRTPMVPQAMAYPPHNMTPGPVSKRARTTSGQPQGVPQVAEVFDDEEDTSRGDAFDHLTPREVAESRYKQNHEWMEEIISSAVPTGNIVPVDLGLGLGGSLKPVTNGIFETYDSVKHAADPSKEYIGHLDLVKKDLFKQRVDERMEADKKEMAKMKKRHEKNLAKMAKNKALKDAELALRTAVTDPSDTGSEFWRLEGRMSTPDDDDEAAEKAPVKTATKKVDDIVKALEASLGLTTAAVQDFKLVQKGGLQEIAPPPPPPEIFTPMNSMPPMEQERHTGPGTPHSSLLVGDHDLEMGSAAGLLDQYHTGFSAATTPGNSYTPQHIPGMSAINSAVASPMPAPAHSPVYGQGMQQQQQQPQQQSQHGDVEMGGMGGADSLKSETGDWVVVPKPGVSPNQSSGYPTQGQSQPQNQTQGQTAQAPRPTPAPILPPGYGPSAAARQSLSQPPAAPSPNSVPPVTQSPAPARQGTSASPAPPANKPAPILPPGITSSGSFSHPGSAAPTPAAIPQPAASAASPAVPSPAPGPGVESANASTPMYHNNSEPVDFSGLDDLGTGFGEDIEMDDSAFGEAFHGVSPRGEEGHGHGDDSTL